MHAVRVKANRQPAALLTVGLIFSVSMVLVWGVLKPADHAFDDAFITYHYADNFRQGFGLVYNPGEWVLGTTTPLFALLLGILGFVFTDIAVIGHWVGILSWVAAVALAGALFGQAERRYAALAAMLFVALQPIMLSVMGMETALVIALMLASAWTWFDKRNFLTAVLLAALIVTRADGVLWAAIIGMAAWRRHGRFPWSVTLLTILLASPWFLYAQWRYGSFLPNSVAAKAGQAVHMTVGGQGTFVQGLADIWAWMPTLVWVLFGLLLLAGLWIIIKDAHDFWYLPIWVIVYLTAYSLLGVANFTWYYAPPAIMVTLIAALGAGGLLGDGRVFGQTSKLSWTLAAFSVCASLVLAVFSVRQLAVVSTQQGYRAAYPPIGHWLNQNTPAMARAATIEIGVIGYLSERPLLDTMGLVSPEMTSRQVGWTETLAYAVSQLWPEYAVVLENTAWDWVIEQWWFADYYKPASHFSDAVIYQLQNRPVLPYQATNVAEYPVGFTLTGADFSAQQLQPGQTLELWLNVTVQQDQNADYSFTVYLVDAQTDERTAVTTADPLNGGYRTSVWQPGDRLSLPMRLTVPEDLAPGVYQMGLFIYDPESGKGLPTTITPAQGYPEVKFGWLRYGTPENVASENLVFQNVQAAWQEGIRLENLALPSTKLTSGDVLPITLQWTVHQSPQRNLTLFIHLINEAGEILAQHDQRPFAGRFPTPGWQPGERLDEPVQLQLPPDLPSGSYGLRLGFYDENGRLPLLNGSSNYLQLSNLIQVYNP